MSEEDRKAIERLHKTDIEASRKLDYETLRSLWSQDIVVMSPGSQPTRGIQAAWSALQGTSNSYARIQIIDYRQNWEETVIQGEFAWQWGQILGAARDLNSGKLQQYVYNVMRVLQKQENGEWKVHRTIWNAAR